VAVRAEAAKRKRRAKASSAIVKTGRGHGRRMAVTVCIVIAAMVLTPAASPAGATVTGSGGTIGRFTFGGALTGTVTTDRSWNVPPGGSVVAGCQITTTSTDADLNLFNAKLKQKGHLVTINGGSSGVAATVDIQVSKAGNKESLSGLNAAALVTFNAFINGKAHTWQSNTTPASKLKGGGTLKTNAKNTAGSIDAKLIPGAPTTGETALTVKGSWSYCKPFEK
jgi:hypothetical protein